jgi:hypothetical protein
MSPLSHRVSRILAAFMAFVCVGAGVAFAHSTNGRLGGVAGRVTDRRGDPMAGVTVLAVGPLFETGFAFGSAALRTVTDAHGRFYLLSLVPGWYAVEVRTSTKGLEAAHRIRVQGGSTSIRNFVLTGIISSSKLRAPTAHSVLSATGDWKWILRTSATLRPVLRFDDPTQSSAQDQSSQAEAVPSEMMAGLLPGSLWDGGINADTGEQNVYALLKPINGNSDILVAGALSSEGVLGPSFSASYRRGQTGGSAQEYSVSIHQLNAGPATSGSVIGSAGSPGGAQAVSVRTSREMRLSDSLTLTSGVDVDTILARSGAAQLLPHAKLTYHWDDGSILTFQYGAIAPYDGASLADRVTGLNAFPQMTMEGNHIALERVNHAEVQYDHPLGPKAHFQAAAYHDSFSNAAVNALGFGQAGDWLAGMALPGPVAGSEMLNGGRYGSTGFRTAVTYQIDSNAVGTLLYSYGDALIVRQMASNPLASAGQLNGVLKPGAGQSLGGKISATVPHAKTQITASYFMVPGSSVTVVDPYGMASNNVMPYLGVEIRQPLPGMGFLPAHFEAMADFTNVLGQGYIPFMRSGEEPFIMTAMCRTIRGGFSVQF